MKLGIAFAAALVLMSSAGAQAATCRLKPKQVAEQFFDLFYVKKEVRKAFETWVDPAYIQHNPMAATGRDSAINFLEPFFAANKGVSYSIKRIIGEGDLIAVHSHAKLSDTHRGMAIVDIVRVEGCKIMEHWDVVQAVPDSAMNTNTMF